MDMVAEWLIVTRLERTTILFYERPLRGLIGGLRQLRSWSHLSITYKGLG